MFFLDNSVVTWTKDGQVISADSFKVLQVHYKYNVLGERKKQPKAEEREGEREKSEKKLLRRDNLARERKRKRKFGS